LVLTKSTAVNVWIVTHAAVGHNANHDAASDARFGAALGYGYDGALLLHETWSGIVTGEVAWTSDHDFRITAERVRGARWT
jgi:hypothetical protein